MHFQEYFGRSKAVDAVSDMAGILDREKEPWPPKSEKIVFEIELSSASSAGLALPPQKLLVEKGPTWRLSVREERWRCAAWPRPGGQGWARGRSTVAKAIEG